MKPLFNLILCLIPCFFDVIKSDGVNSNCCLPPRGAFVGELDADNQTYTMIYDKKEVFTYYVKYITNKIVDEYWIDENDCVNKKKGECKKMNCKSYRYERGWNEKKVTKCFNFQEGEKIRDNVYRFTQYNGVVVEEVVDMGNGVCHLSGMFAGRYKIIKFVDRRTESWDAPIRCIPPI